MVAIATGSRCQYDVVEVLVPSKNDNGVAGKTDFSIRFPQPRKIPAYSSVLVSVESTGIQSMPCVQECIVTIDYSAVTIIIL